MWIINVNTTNFDNQNIVKIDVVKDSDSFVHFRKEGERAITRLAATTKNYIIRDSEKTMEWLKNERLKYQVDTIGYKFLNKKINQVISNKNADSSDVLMFFHRIETKNFLKY